MVEKKWIGRKYKCACPKLNQGGRDRIEFALGAYSQDVKLQPDRAGRRLQIFRYGISIRIGGIYQQSNDVCGRHEFAKQFQLLCLNYRGNQAYTCQIPSWTIEAINKTGPDWVSIKNADDWDCR